MDERDRTASTVRGGKTYKIYTEVFGYNKLLEDAKKRNSPFFDVLMKDFRN